MHYIPGSAEDSPSASTAKRSSRDPPSDSFIKPPFSTRGSATCSSAQQPRGRTFYYYTVGAFTHRKAASLAIVKDMSVQSSPMGLS